MREWVEQFRSSSRETKWFILNWAVYAILIIVSLFYCYWRVFYIHEYEKRLPLSQELPLPNLNTIDSKP